MKRLLALLLILCAAAVMFACTADREEPASDPADTTQTTTQDTPVVPSASLIPADSVPAIQPVLPSGTLPHFPVPTDRPPDATIPSPPPITKPKVEYS